MDELVEFFNILVKRIAQGDISALDDIYEQYSGLFFAIAKKYINDKQKAEDVVSEALCKVVRGAKTFNANQNGLNWMFKIIKNICMDWNKKDARNIVDDNVELQNLADVVASHENFAEHIELKIALQKLSNEENELIKLRFWERLTVREIAHELKMPKSTVQVHLDNTLKKLFNLLK